MIVSCEGEREREPSGEEVKVQAGEGCWRQRVRASTRTSSPMVAIRVRSLYCVVVAIPSKVSNPEESDEGLALSHHTRNSLAMTETAENGVKTLRLSWNSDPDLDSQIPRVAIGRTGDAFVLVAADSHDQDQRGGAYISSLSVLVNEDPFPGLSMAGKQMIWVSPFDWTASTPACTPCKLTDIR